MEATGVPTASVGIDGYRAGIGVSTDNLAKFNILGFGQRQGGYRWRTTQHAYKQAYRFARVFIAGVFVGSYSH